MKVCKTCSDAHRAGPGASTVLLILLVMCLAMLGALSLSVARNDLAVTQRAIEAENAYYQAQKAVARKLAEMDEAIITAGDDFSAIEGWQKEAGLISFDTPVDEFRSIRLTLQPLGPAPDQRYKVIENRVFINE